MNRAPWIIFSFTALFLIQERAYALMAAWVLFFFAWLYTFKP